MDKLKKVADAGLNIIYFLFIAIFLFNILQVSSPRWIVIYVAIIVISILMYLFGSKLKIKVKINKKILFILGIIFVLIGVGVRIFILNLNHAEPYSDYSLFFNNASNFAQNNCFSSKYYIALFPYLTSYIVLLGSFFKVVGISIKSAILLNIIFDIMAALLLFVTFRKKFLNKAILLSVLYLINPISIMWCVAICPISIVNFFIVAALCVLEKFEGKIEGKVKNIIYNIFLGILLGIANQFRPIFVIFIIALVLYRIYIILFEKDAKKIMMAVSILVLGIAYFVTGKLILSNMQKINPEEKFATTQGWTIYLGANIESNGIWNLTDSMYFNAKMAGKTPQEVQIEMQKEAIERYKNNGFKGNALLMKEKFKVLTAYSGEYSSSAFASLEPELTGDRIDVCIKFISKLLFFLIVLSNIFVMFNKTEMKNKILYMLLSIGIVISHLLVEVSQRYSLHVYIVMIVFMVLYMQNFKKEKCKLIDAQTTENEEK